MGGNFEDLRRTIDMLVGLIPSDLAKADLDGDGQLGLADVRVEVQILVGIP